ncbi:MAG: NUDIX hydrolase [Promethearchaeota archaeon]
MITFEKNGYIFSYRVAGVIIHEGKVLVHRNIIDDFWSLPGGRCEFLEISKDALIREMKEEIGVEVEIIRPLYFVENFFYFEGKNYHEISIFYLMECNSDSKIIFENDTFHGREFKLIFKWVDISTIGTIKLYPLFLRKALKNIKSFPEHIINWDD